MTRPRSILAYNQTLNRKRPADSSLARWLRHA
jgi:hypothetical protein